MTTSAQAERHQTDLALLVAAAIRALRALWPSLGSRPDQVRDGLIDALPELVAFYGSAAGTLGADWYEDTRDELAVPGRFRARPAPLPDRGRTDALARWGSEPVFRADSPDPALAQSLVEGGLQRIVSNASRETIIGSSLADPATTGWQRIGRGAGDCAFCRMLIARGAVYSEATVSFGAHDNCDCMAVPAFGGLPVPVKPYTPSLRESSEADRARVREYIRANNL